RTARHQCHACLCTPDSVTSSQGRYSTLDRRPLMCIKPANEAACFLRSSAFLQKLRERLDVQEPAGPYSDGALRAPCDGWFNFTRYVLWRSSRCLRHWI